MHYPPIEDIISRTDSPKLLEVNRSVLSITSAIIWFILSSSLVIIILNYFGNINISIPFLSSIKLRWIVLIPAIQLLAILRLYHDNLYVFYKTRMTHLGGRLSLQYYVPEVNYKDIRAISVQQDILGRMLDYGNIQIDTAALDKSEIIIEGVRAPFELSKIIELFRAYELKQFNSIAPSK